MKLFKFNISLLTLLFCLSIQANETLEFPYKFRIKKSNSYKHLGPENHISGIDNNRNYTDLDKDGIPDLMDADIDGDGVLNFLDYSPLDKKVKGIDSDQDGIMDFLDFEVNGLSKEGMSPLSAKLQKLLLQKKGIIIFNGDKLFSNEEFQRLAYLFLEKELKEITPLSNLRVIFKQPTSSMGYRAKFNNSQKTITLYQNLDHEKSSLHQELSVVHEFFHALSYEKEGVWNDFLQQSGWVESDDFYLFQGIEIAKSTFRANPLEVTKLVQGAEFPNDYSKLGPEEMFAECATASLMMLRGRELILKYPQIHEYKATKLHFFFQNSFRSLFK